MRREGLVSLGDAFVPGRAGLPGKKGVSGQGLGVRDRRFVVNGGFESRREWEMVRTEGMGVGGSAALAAALLPWG